MRLLRPEMAVWLLALPVAVACWALQVRARWRHRRASDPVPHLRTTSRRSGPARDVAVLTLSVMAIALLAGALMRPQVIVETRTPEFEPRDLILILDRSVSMRARDIRPSRFDRALDEIGHFLRHKPDTFDRVGIVGFAGTALVISYPTRDVDSLLFYLDWLRDDPTTLFGTDIGGALESALSVVRREPVRVAPVFMLVSDGDDHGPALERAAATVRRAGIRIYAVGIGSDASVPMPVATGGGREELLKDDAGRLMTTRFDERTLRRLSSLTDGRYFRSTTGAELAPALAAIGTAARRQTGWTVIMEYRDLYPWFLAGAAIAATGLLLTLL